MVYFYHEDNKGTQIVFTLSHSLAIPHLHFLIIQKEQFFYI